MSAQTIFDTAPLGSLISYSDGKPKPPARFVNKLRAWQRSNGIGRLIRRDAPIHWSTYASPAGITLHQGDFASGGVVVMTVHHTYLVTSDLAFAIVARPAPGSILVLHPWGGHVELLHLALDRSAAQAWLAKNHYSDAVLEEAPSDASAASSIVGRVA
jgi:hypothetical protein